MSQYEIYNLLKEKPKKWMSSQDIYDIFVSRGQRVGLNTVQTGVRKLHKHKILKIKQAMSTKLKQNRIVYYYCINEETKNEQK